MREDLETGRDAEKIASRLDVLGRHVHGTVYRDAFSDAASAIRTLARLAKLTALTDEDSCADLATPFMCDATKEMCLTLSRKDEPLARIIMTPENAYDLASSILTCYDKLVGIK